MKCLYWKVIFGTLALVILALAAANLSAQTTGRSSWKTQAAPQLPAHWQPDDAGKSLGKTNQSGELSVACLRAPCRVHVIAPGFQEQVVVLTAAATIRLQPSAQAEQITVTAYRAPLGELESPEPPRACLSQQASNNRLQSRLTASCARCRA